jgi:pyridoxal phosphate enzyme (YggS family)
VAELVTGLDPARVGARLEEAEQRIAHACARSGRSPGDVELLAATKYVPAEELGVLAEAGVRLVGENTAAALEAKQERWGERFTWDFIGHLQSRKTRMVLPRVRMIHAVDSESVMRQIDRHARDQRPDQMPRLLLEVNVGGEESKHGVAPGEVDRFLETAEPFGAVRFAGLMTMPPLVRAPGEARPHVAALRELAERLQAAWSPRHEFTVLSMGTSQDYEVAVEEGATVCRLGGVLYTGAGD